MSNFSVHLSVVIPAHNEAENLRVLIPELDSALQHVSAELVVVNNASTDVTARMLRELQKELPRLVIVEEPVLGYGRAVLAGLCRAHGETIAIMRGDRQEHPRDVARMYAFHHVHGYEVSKGVRHSRAHEGVRRIVVSWFFNRLFRAVFQVPFRDINAAPKFFSRRFYEQARLESLDWFLDAEIMLKAVALDCKIGEMEIEYLPRVNGRSTVRLRHIKEFVRNIAQWRARKTHGGYFLS